MEPAYAFTAPSIGDGTLLDCRIYHPESFLESLLHDKASFKPKGAVIAHPYAPLGGCYDDPVVLAVTAQLVKQGYVVTTFNFRGAAESHGSTSWSAKGEKDDYTTVVGFAIYYLRVLFRSGIVPDSEQHQDVVPVQLILAGYSYGSLILTRLPPLHVILRRFETASIGTNAAEVILRARRLATETHHAALELAARSPARGRPSSASIDGRPRAHSNTVSIGGDETPSGERRSSRASRESRRGLDMVKKGVEMPHRIALHLRRGSSNKSQEDVAEKATKENDYKDSVHLLYLLISPLLPPLSYTLVPPNQMMQLFGQQSKDTSTGFGSLDHATLAIWGVEDGFSSSKKLTAWIERLRSEASASIEGVAIDEAGHFWRERGVLKQLCQKVASWSEAHGD